jgi:hypothetical protein
MKFGFIAKHRGMCPSALGPNPSYANGGSRLESGGDGPIHRNHRK